MKCRHCGELLQHKFVDLGHAPPSNAYLEIEKLSAPEIYYPLFVKVCDQCWLVQTEDYTKANELFNSDYAYFSSTSSSWLAHAKAYFDKIIAMLFLDQNSQVVEIASNDGYLLRHFVNAGVPCLGIEPTASTALAAERQGIPVLREFFGNDLACRLAKEDLCADLIIGNNVYAHVPDINDFTRGLAALLKPDGVVTLEFPHLLNLIQFSQFDTVYHEHFSYLSLGVVQRIFAEAGLHIWDVEELVTHGGSLRIYGCLKTSARKTTNRLNKVLAKERAGGLELLKTYTDFQAQAEKIKIDLLTFLITQKCAGKRVAAYGAAAKGNTLLNYAGVKKDLISYVCDAAVAKQGKYLPGSLIPIVAPNVLSNDSPDWVLILPWNIVDEVMDQLKKIVSKNTKFIVAVPELRIL